jgi:DNA-binding Xre family transcriptional regulator
MARSAVTALRIDRDSLGKLCHTLGCTPGDLLEFVGRQSEEVRS